MTIAMLWLPILVSAAGVFIASSIIHMVLRYHQSDFSKLPAEDEIMAAIRSHGTPPGNYFMPHCPSAAGMKDPAYRQKLAEGPVALLLVDPPGPPNIGKALAQWFVFSLLVSIFAAYLTGHALAPGADYLEVFRFAGTTAFGAYALAQLQDSIWYKRAWSTTLKNLFDGLVYALVTAGVFGWLWPAA